RIEERAPRFGWSATVRVEAVRDLHLLKLYRVRRRHLDRLGDPKLLDQAADDRSLTAVDACLDAGIVSNRDKGGLNRADRPIGVLADENISVVNIHAHHPTGSPHHPLGDEVTHDPGDAAVAGAHPPVPNVDDRSAVSLQGGG